MVLCIPYLHTLTDPGLTHLSFHRIGNEQDGTLIAQRLYEIKALQVQIKTELEGSFNQFEGKVEKQNTMLSCVYSSVQTEITTTYGRPDFI
jgi:hypothetical protein